MHIHLRPALMYVPEVRKILVGGLGRTARAVCAMAGAEPPAVTVTPGGNAVVNDEALTAQTAAVFKATFGDKARPLAAPANHSPFFAPTPEPSIRTGVRAMSLAVLNALQ